MTQGKRGGTPAGPAKGSGARQMHTRVKTAKGRKLSSQLWLQRQLNDPYVAAAKREGYRSRAAYKLVQIDDKHRLLKPGYRVLDLGAAPGGWTQVAVERVQSSEGRGQVIAVDISSMDPVVGATVLLLDFMHADAPALIKAELKGQKANLVLSDMAASGTGHRHTDHLRIMALCEAALAFAREVLAPGGAFLGKVLQGGTENALLAEMKRDFATVRHLKPAASRTDSAELYVLATGFRG